ncbi:MAG: hypothetical protein JNL13_12495 [Chitinophagaceae bacterium]|nr:hypothetical protein [Chitinophagaceae bacterium]
MFSSDNPFEQWDGTFKGQGLNVGVYYYFMKVLFNYYGAKEEMHKGDISLLR